MPSGEWLESTTPISGMPSFLASATAILWKPTSIDEDGVRQRVHVLDAADVLLELVHLAREHQLLLLAHGVEAGFLLGLHVLQALDRGLDGLEVGQHAAEPALVDEGHAGALRLRRRRSRAPGAWCRPSGWCRGWRPAAWRTWSRPGTSAAIFSRLMMWILLRWPKMNGAILGFQKRVWWPKWTPASSISRMDDGHGELRRLGLKSGPQSQPWLATGATP